MATLLSKKRKFIADGVFFAELNEVLIRELAKDGYSVVEIRVHLCILRSSSGLREPKIFLTVVEECFNELKEHIIPVSSASVIVSTGRRHSIDSNDGRGGGGFVVLGGRSFRESKNACGEVEGVEKMSSKGPSLWLEVRSVWKVVSVPIEVRINKEGDDF
ncbi:40S ribosomal protein S3-3-like protein, partial [Tanacetum coccineum]